MGYELKSIKPVVVQIHSRNIYETTDSPTHLSILAIPGFNTVNLRHGPASQCGSRATAHRQLPEEKINQVSPQIQPSMKCAFVLILIVRQEETGAPPTWGTHECQSHWRSPSGEQISSCVCWWQPWQGSQIHQYPKRTPAPSGLLPQSTASWWRESSPLVSHN